MVSFTSTIVTMIAAISLCQMGPAPPALLPAILPVAAAGAGSIAGNVMGKKLGKRETELRPRALPPGVPTYVVDLCVSQIKGQGRPVEINDVDATTILVKNVPPACMTLATVITDKPAQEGGAFPIPMGTDSLKYINVSAADREALLKLLGTKA